MQAKPRDGRGVDAPGWALGTRDPHGSGTLTQSRWDAPREYQPTPLEQCVGSPHGAALSPMVGLVTSPSPGMAHGDSVGYFTWSEALGEGEASFSSSDALQMGSPTSLWVLSCSAMGSLSLGYREDPNHDSDELSHRAAGQQGRAWGCWAKVISCCAKGKTTEGRRNKILLRLAPGRASPLLLWDELALAGGRCCGSKHLVAKGHRGHEPLTRFFPASPTPPERDPCAGSAALHVGTVKQPKQRLRLYQRPSSEGGDGWECPGRIKPLCCLLPALYSQGDFPQAHLSASPLGQ